MSVGLIGKKIPQVKLSYPKRALRAIASQEKQAVSWRQETCEKPQLWNDDHQCSGISTTSHLCGIQILTLFLELVSSKTPSLYHHSCLLLRRGECFCDYGVGVGNGRVLWWEGRWMERG